MTTKVQNLIDSAWREVESRRDLTRGNPVARPAFEPLGTARSESRFGDDFAVLAELDAAIDLAREHELGALAQGLREVQGDIRWSQNPSYDETTVSRELLDGYAYVGLSGPDSPIRCEAPLCGFLVMGANITYADHKHGPPEIYLVLTPGSQWRLDRGDWFDVAPGDLIRHDSWQWHATRSFAQPFLAFVAWLEPGDRSKIDI